MFTIKFYSDSGRCVIKAAESFTILRTEATGEAEVTLHQKLPELDSRIDIFPASVKRMEGWPPVFQWAYIENVSGKTVESIHLKNVPA